MERSAVNSDAVGVPAAPVQPAPAPARPAPLLVSQHDQGEQRDVREAWEVALRRKRWVRWFVSWLPHRLTIAVRSLLRWQHLVTAKIRHRWHRSLQLRVVGTTLLISAAVIAVLGFFLTEQIADGLLYNAENLGARAGGDRPVDGPVPAGPDHAADPADRDAVHAVHRPAAAAGQRHGQLQLQRGGRAERRTWRASPGTRSGR